MYQEKLYEHFCRYVAISSQSDASATSVPSTEGQRTLAKQLTAELTALDLEKVHLDEQHAIVTALLPSNQSDKNLPAVGFIAHLDTVDVSLSPDIHPQRINNYDGKDICLNPEQQIYLRTSEHPEILAYQGDDIIVTDGTSVLGADNKAAIAAIMVAVDAMQRQNLPHGDVYICFVPDEEIGLRGAKTLDLSTFPVDFAYTIDCCGIGEVVYRTFNAATAIIEIQGVSAHPMSAKGVLLNPTLIAVDLINLLNRLETPENTENTEGYIWAHGINSNQSSATVELNIRDHDRHGFQAKKHYLEKMVELTRLRYPRASITLNISDTYSNIADAITAENRQAIDHLFTAMKNLDITPKDIAMRGGTDGSYLSSQGILTPNFFTGAHNFHSNCEFLPLKSFNASCQMVLELCQLITQSGETR